MQLTWTVTGTTAYCLRQAHCVHPQFVIYESTSFVFICTFPVGVQAFKILLIYLTGISAFAFIVCAADSYRMLHKCLKQ